MRALLNVLGNYSVFKGKIFTIIGLVIISAAIFIMIKSQSISAESIELTLLGLTVAGLNKSMLDKFKSVKDEKTSTTDTPKSESL